MTDEAQKFVAPLTFEALSGRPVRTSTFQLVESSDPQHISLTERADLMLVAPATNNIIAKVAHGLCDDLVSLMVCAAACPVVFAPAMNNRMWHNPIARRKTSPKQISAGLGYRFIGPEPKGWLACRNLGIGRMTDPGRDCRAGRTNARIRGNESAPSNWPICLVGSAISERFVHVHRSAMSLRTFPVARVFIRASDLRS